MKQTSKVRQDEVIEIRQPKMRISKPKHVILMSNMFASGIRLHGSVTLRRLARSLVCLTQLHHQHHSHSSNTPSPHLFCQLLHHTFNQETLLKLQVQPPMTLHASLVKLPSSESSLLPKSRRLLLGALTRRYLASNKSDLKERSASLIATKSLLPMNGSEMQRFSRP